MKSATANSKQTVIDYLVLFVTGDSPRSQRARANLEQALHQLGVETGPREINLLECPAQAVEHGIFATPALMDTRNKDNPHVIYGDLSDTDTLERFLGNLK